MPAVFAGRMGLLKKTGLFSGKYDMNDKLLLNDLVVY